MKKIYGLCLYILLSINVGSAYAADDDAGLLGGEGSEVGGDGGTISAERIRNGDLHLDDIPEILKGMVDIFMSFSATIAVIFVIIGAYQILFGSITEGGKTKGKNTIMMALGGFALASLSWVIIKLILDNFS